jgi:hypothetical protein
MRKAEIVILMSRTGHRGGAEESKEQRPFYRWKAMEEQAHDESLLIQLQHNERTSKRQIVLRGR